MKKFVIAFVLFASLSISESVLAQIPDAGFESWSGGAPVGWTTDNSPGVDTVIWRTTDSHSGTYAAEGVATHLYTATITPVLSAGVTWTTRSATFSGYYKYSPVGGDTLIIAAVFAKNGGAIGAGLYKTTATVSSYTQFSIPISYVSASAPDSAAIQITIIPASGSSAVHAGSTFEIDDLSFSGATGVATGTGQTPSSFALSQNFPNPFNPSTSINYQLPAAGHVSLTVFNMLGESVATLVDGEQSAGSHVVRWTAGAMPSGIYFYRLTAGSYTSVKKLTLLK